MTPIEIPEIVKDTNKLWEWIFRLLLLVGFFWLKTTYVGIGEFNAYKAASEKSVGDTALGITAINNTLIRIDEKMKNDQRQDQLLEKYDERIQKLERKP